MPQSNLHLLELSKSKLDVEIVENEIAKSKITGYTGNAVDLSDYGVEHPVVYNTAGITFKNTIPYLYGHYELIGHATDISVSNGSMTLTGHYSDPGERSQKVANGVKNGIPYQASMGLQIDRKSVVFHEEGSVEVNGKTFEAPIYVVNRSELVEMSAVLFGRDSETNVTPLSKETAMIITNSKTTPPVVPPPVVPPTPPPAPASIEMADVVELMAKYPSYHELIAKSIKNGKDKDGVIDAIKLHQLENNYQSLPTGPHRHDDKIDNSFAARMAHSLGIAPEVIENKVGKPATDFALSRGTMGLKEMLMYVANAEGGRFNGHSDIEGEGGICAHIKRCVKNQSFSTLNFPNLMNRISQWTMEEAWKLDPPWTPGKINETSKNNFLKSGRIRPEGGQMWNGLDKDGKIQHASFGDEVKYEVKLSTVAQIIQFKREDILNDDIGIIEEMLNLMVEGATMVPDYQMVNVIYNGVTSGFLSAAKNNLFNLPLTRENLDLVYEAARQHAIKKGNKAVKTFFNTRWALVHTTQLERTAWEIVKQAVFVAGTESNPQGSQNYFYNKVDLEHFPQLDNQSYHPNADPYAWGLLPVRQQLSPYTIAYLRNQRRPTTETVDLPADMLGFGTRGFWDVLVQERESQTVAWSFPGSGS
jgi:hypothetical protein